VRIGQSDKVPFDRGRHERRPCELGQDRALRQGGPDVKNPLTAEEAAGDVGGW
jgi:hypothetical protein